MDTLKPLDYHSLTIPLAQGQQESSQDFPIIEGRIIGVSTHIIGSRPAKSVRLTLRENGSDKYRPIDVAFSETEGRSSFGDSLLRLDIPAPGRLTAAVIADEALGSGEDFKVEVVLVSEKVTRDTIYGQTC